jgi:hypothetical protein
LELLRGRAGSILLFEKKIVLYVRERMSYAQPFIIPIVKLIAILPVNGMPRFVIIVVVGKDMIM